MTSPDTGNSDLGTGPRLGGLQFIHGEADLDESFYRLDDDEYAFLSSQTDISDPLELKKHVIQIQREVYKIHAYLCIRAFAFVGLKVFRYPAYQDLLRLGRERPNALLLDIGCGVGNDTRKVVADGFPASQIIASDLYPAFWDIGHQVFRSTPETFPVKFVPGDVFDESFLTSGPIVIEKFTSKSQEDVASLTSLTPLRGRLSGIHASSFFHLFNEIQQRELAYKLGSLLSPEAGSLIFGAHAGSPVKGVRMETPTDTEQGDGMFCHSVKSWIELWQEVFGHEKIAVKAELMERTPPTAEHLGVKMYLLIWSVKRV